MCHSYDIHCFLLLSIPKNANIGRLKKMMKYSHNICIFLILQNIHLTDMLVNSVKMRIKV